jgi:putative Flp pilus-assembly TadE/G-like protein
MTHDFLHYLKTNAGNASIIAAIAAIPLFGAAGVAIDYIRQGQALTTLQAAVDSAALAGVAAESNHVQAAEKFFDANIDEGKFLTVSRECSESGTIEVRCDVTATIRSTYTSLLGFDDLGISTTATAVKNIEEPESVACIMTLAPSASQSFLVNSGANVEAEGCEVHVKSTANPAAIFNSGTTLNTDKICIQGSQIIDNGGTHPNLQKPCSTAKNPFAGVLPVPNTSTCNFSNGNYSGNTTLSPGVYCGWHNFNSGSNATLAPGTYIIKDGGWNVNGGTWTGTGVTFYFADTSKIQFNSAVHATLSAPTSGTYKGFLFAEKEGLSDSQFIINDNLGFGMEGRVYLPSREVVFNSNSSLRTKKMTVVSRTMILNNVKWELEAYDKGNSGENAEVRLTK